MTSYATDTDPWANIAPSLAAKLAEFFYQRPNVWIDGRVLASVAGAYAWRTRISDLRKPPFNMHVVNRQRHVDVGGKTITVSEYCFIAQEVQPEDEAAEGVPAPSAAM